MWRKPNEEKPSSQPSNTAAPAVSKPLDKATEPTPSDPIPEQASTPAVVATPVAVRTSAPPIREASRITAGLKINGEFSGDTDLFIDGEVHGKIRLPNARVTIGSAGSVQAEIEAREILIEGTVQGNLKAGESIRLGASSRVTGSVLTPRIGIDDGARLRGKVEMTSGGQGRESASTRNASGSADFRPVTAGATKD